MSWNIPERINLATWCLDRQADAHPERVAILGEPAALTYGELRAVMDRAGNALLASGAQRGDRVLLALADSAEFVGAFLGAVKIGAIAVPVNPFARAADFSYWLQDCGARLAIISGAAGDEFRRAWEAGGKPCSVIVAHSARESVGADWALWDSWLAGQPNALEACQTAATDPAFFLYTSGSTGEPKAAVHQHKDALVTTQAFARDVMQVSPKDRTFSVSKLFFAYGLGNGLYFPLATGASTVLHPDRPKPERVFQLVARHRPSIFYSVPTFYAALLQAAEKGAAADFSSVRLAVSAGEALPAEIFERFKERFGLEILDAIGSTEMLHMFLSSRPGRIRPGSCGHPLEGYQARIVDEQGREVPAGEIGSLWVRGESAFAQYWNKPEATERAKRDGWVITGDKFYRDADGYYFYCGRADDMLKVSGLWVSPTEVENALLAHPAVREAAVVGRTDEAGLTRPVAYLVPHPSHAGRGDLASEIRAFVRERLAAYKCPQALVFVAEIPKTATGKIQRFRLREG